jgi:hypothetical protein
MANNFENTALVTKLAVKEFINAMQLLGKVDRQWDKSLQSKTKDATIDIRRPVMFSTTSGATFSSQGIQEAVVSLTLDKHEHVGFTITQKDLKLDVDEMTTRYIRPAMIALAQKVESDIAAEYVNIGNFVGTPGQTPSTFLDVGAAKTVLDELGVPDEGTTCAFFTPQASLQLSNGLRGVFPQEIAKKAIEKAAIGDYAGAMLYKNQSLKVHTVGVATGSPLVNGAAQNVTYETATSGKGWSQSLITDGWTNSTTGILKAGDVITITNADGTPVNRVNRRTGEDTGSLQTFTVLANVNSGASTGPATLTISPPIITSGAYKTVSVAPSDDAVISVVSGASGAKHPQNLMFHPNAITVGMAPFDVPTSGADSSMQSYDGVSIAAVRQFDIDEYETKFRFDILYGIKVQNPDFAVRITG